MLDVLESVLLLVPSGAILLAALIRPQFYRIWAVFFHFVLSSVFGFLPLTKFQKNHFYFYNFNIAAFFGYFAIPSLFVVQNAICSDAMINLTSIIAILLLSSAGNMLLSPYPSSATRLSGVFFITISLSYLNISILQKLIFHTYFFSVRFVTGWLELSEFESHLLNSFLASISYHLSSVDFVNSKEVLKSEASNFTILVDAFDVVLIGVYITILTGNLVEDQFNSSLLLNYYCQD